MSDADHRRDLDRLTRDVAAARRMERRHRRDPQRKDHEAMNIEISGHSDDIISIHRLEGDDEIGASSSDITRIRVATIGGARTCFVACIYNGTWSFAPEMVEESRKLPPWKFTVDNMPDHEYSTRLTIDTGDDIVTVEPADEEGDDGDA